VVASQPRSLAARVAELRRHGLFTADAALDDDSLLVAIGSRLEALDMDPSEDMPVWMLLLGDVDRAYYGDTEMVESNGDAYAGFIADLARISRGAFQPAEITETWDPTGASVTVSYRLDGGRVELTPRVQGDWLDPSVIGTVNTAIADTGLQFEAPDFGFGQDFLLVALRASEKQGLARDLGWRFA
jgi:hypothetical protein